MITVTIGKANGSDGIRRVSFGIWQSELGHDYLIKSLHQNGISEEEVVSLTMEADEIELRWGAQFSAFPSLTELVLTARNTIRLNCYNFAESTIRTVSLSASELWFNDGAFAGAGALEYVSCTGTILDGQHGGLTELLFMDCPRLKAVRGFYRGKTVMPGVFGRCTSLEEPLDLYVRHLGHRTFMDCTSLKRIHLHNGLIDLGNGAFMNCTSLEDVYVPDTVTSLGWETFSGCKNLKSVHLPKCLSEIPSGVFAGCAALGKVFLSDEIIRIDSEAFRGCSSLRSPWLPDRLEFIGKKAFQGCTSMGEIFLPDSVTEIGEDAFSDCGELVLRGHAGSYAQRYAKDNHLTFVAKQETK